MRDQLDAIACYRKLRVTWSPLAARMQVHKLFWLTLFGPVIVIHRKKWPCCWCSAQCSDDCVADAHIYMENMLVFDYMPTRWSIRRDEKKQYLRFVSMQNMKNETKGNWLICFILFFSVRARCMEVSGYPRSYDVIRREYIIILCFIHGSRLTQLTESLDTINEKCVITINNFCRTYVCAHALVLYSIFPTFHRT